MNQTVAFAPVRKTVRVKAPLTRAFEVFTASSWWPREHSILKGTRQQVVLIEPRAGGRWFERGEDGSECDWGKVLAWEPPTRLLLSWQLNGNFQVDPSLVTEVEVTFISEDANLTRVELEHRYIERAGDTAAALRAGVDSPGGWAGLLERFAEAAGGSAH
jgi:uncharacterized protein YndB with AHSA1/START domain